MLHDPFEEVERQEMQASLEEAAREAAARGANSGAGASGAGDGNPQQHSGAAQLSLTFPSAGAAPPASPAAGRGFFLE